MVWVWSFLKKQEEQHYINIIIKHEPLAKLHNKFAYYKDDLVILENGKGPNFIELLNCQFCAYCAISIS